MFKIDYLEIGATVSSIYKEMNVENLPTLAPVFLVLILLWAIKLMIDDILSTKLGATIALGCIALFLVNQGVIF